MISYKPNPLNRGTIISFQLPEACEAAITIYDISGRVVKIPGIAMVLEPMM
ncbi:MAG: T9SS type A sorting domain-containing protein [Saprospiraceae bacterium]